MPSELYQCAGCPLEPEDQICRTREGDGPDGCPTLLQESAISGYVKHYDDPDTREFARQASLQEASCYAERDTDSSVLHPVKPRLQEICEFAHRMGYRLLGLAFCSGLREEARVLEEVLKGHGFDLVSVVCKVGCEPKEGIGISDAEKVRVGQFEVMCNPISQAELLNDAGTELNIMMGLCVGHDCLFLEYSKAPTTVFAVKDRVLGHNPLAAIYTRGSYYARLG
jgi:uncharacterized metal-binding protein